MIFIDTHVHFYPCYDFYKFFSFLFENLNNIKLQNKGINGFGIILTERNDCNFFNDLFKNNEYANDCLEHGLEIKETSLLFKNEKNCLPVKFYPARQVSTSEKVEVLALFHENTLPENISLTEQIQHIHEAGSIPVINWAPGKWLGKRGEIIRKFLKNQNKPILLGVTSLLSKGFPYPQIIKDNPNIPVIAGSDPLPFPGQEKLPGSLGILIRNQQSLPNNQELKNTLLNNSFEIYGKRDTPLNTLTRLIKNELTRKRN